MLPASNARLLEIGAGEFTADYDQPATQGPPRWEGSADAYVVEELKTSRLIESGAAGSVAVDERVVTYIVLEASIGRIAQRGDTITYATEEGTRTRTVRNTRTTPIVGTTRITFEDA